MKKYFRSVVLLPLVIVAAVAFVVYQVKSRAPVEHAQSEYPATAVEVITARPVSFRAHATAYGIVEPSVVVNVKTEVSGRVIFLHPGLEKGASLEQGTVVVRIEPTTFELGLAQSEASLQGSRSGLVQLQAEEASTRGALEIARENLSVGEQELARTRNLQAKNLVASSTLDKEVQKVLALRQQVQDIEGRLAAFESRREAILAQIDQSQSVVEKSQDTLGRTEISLPMDARIGEISVEQGEFVPAGSTLFTALGVEAVEIDAQLPVIHFRPLVTGLRGEGAASLVNLRTPAALQNVLHNMQLQARVHLIGESDPQISWPGQLLQISESIDPVRDTLGLLVQVDDPYAGIIPGIKPPLLKGMSVAVEIHSPPKSTLVLPRKALHEGRVYVVGEAGRLQILPVGIAFYAGDLVVPDQESGAALEGRQIVVSDLIPVIQGLPLKVFEAPQVERWLEEKARGPVD